MKRMKVGVGGFSTLLLILFCNCCFASLNCGLQTPRSELDTDQDPYPGQFPWLVRLDIYFDNQTNYKNCGGSLISDRWVLTSAFCVKVDEAIHQKITKIKIHLGIVEAGDLEQNDGSEYFATKIVHHPCLYGSEGRWMFDFALIQLGSMIKFNSNIKPICLPDEKCVGQHFDPFEPGIDNCRQAQIAGWGLNEQGNELKKMEYGRLEIPPQGECSGEYRGHTGLKMCAKNTTSKCFEDNGGPVMCKAKDSSAYFQIGIISDGYCKSSIRSYPR